MHGSRTGQKGQDDKAVGDSAHNGKNQPEPVDLCDRWIKAANRISEQQLADKGSQCRGKKGNVDVFRYLFLHDNTKEQNTDKRRPHIDKVETVEGVCDDQHISRKRCGVRTYPADVYDDAGDQAANTRVEQGAAQSAEGKVVGYQLAGRREYATEIFKKAPFLRIEHGDRHRRKEKQAYKQGIGAYEPFVEGRLSLRTRRGDRHRIHMFS